MHHESHYTSMNYYNFTSINNFHHVTFHIAPAGAYRRIFTIDQLTLSCASLASHRPYDLLFAREGSSGGIY